MDKSQAFPQMVLEQLDIYRQERERGAWGSGREWEEEGNLDVSLTFKTNTKSEWITDLNIKGKTIKLYLKEENIFGI